MRLRVTVEEPADHTLVLRAVLPRLALEEVHAALRKRNRDFYSLLPERKLLGRWQEIIDDL